MAWSSSWTGHVQALGTGVRRRLDGFLLVPLHAREVVEADGFGAEGSSDFGDRRRRLELLRRHGVGGYGRKLTEDGLLEVLALRLGEMIEAIRTTARSGDATYQGMLDHGADRLLPRALQRLDEV